MVRSVTCFDNAWHVKGAGNATHGVVVCHFEGNGEVIEIDHLQDGLLNVCTLHCAKVVLTALDVAQGECNINGDQGKLLRHGGARHGDGEIDEGKKRALISLADEFCRNSKLNREALRANLL